MTASHYAGHNGGSDEPETTAPEMRLLRVEVGRLASAVTQLSSVLATIAHDVRATREKVNVIEARMPRKRRTKT